MKIDLTRCLSMQKRATGRIPGMTQLLSKRPDMYSLGVWPGYFSRAQGVQVTDLDGNRYVDMSIGGIGATVLGYADQDVDDAVVAAVRSGVTSSLNCPEEVELAERLCDLHPFADKVRFARTGGEAMAMAVRIARAATGRDVVAFCGYHGWHDWYLAANLEHDALGGHLLEGLEPAGVPRALAGTALPFHYNRIDELKAIIAAAGPKLAAVVMEPIRNEPPEPGFLVQVRQLADSCGAVLVFDEISAGFRLAVGGSHLVLSEVRPDIAVFAKAMGNGYPVAAVIGREEVMQAVQRTFISSTFWTDRIGPVAALATLTKFQALGVHRHLIAIGEKVQNGWREIGRGHGLDLGVGGIAPMSHFSFPGALPDHQKALFIQLMLERGYLASDSFYAMLAHTEKHVLAYLEAADMALGGVAKAMAEGRIQELLEGKPASSGFARLN